MSTNGIAVAAAAAAAAAVAAYTALAYTDSLRKQRVGRLAIEDLKSRYTLLPHPEGGFFAETYRAESTVETSYGTRNASTAIYFLITPGSVSRLHKITADECWHFYLGGPLTVLEISEDGTLTKTTLGQDKGQHVQYVVKAGTWFGSYPNKGTEYSFVGCTVAPGFDFSDFKLASRAGLCKQYPQHEKEIARLTLGLP